MKQLKKIIGYSLIGILIMGVLLSIFVIEDDVYIQKYYEGFWYKDILNYVEYLFFWVLPYWWLVILLGGFILGIIIFLINHLYTISSNKLNE